MQHLCIHVLQKNTFIYKLVNTSCCIFHWIEVWFTIEHLNEDPVVTPPSEWQSFITEPAKCIYRRSYFDPIKIRDHFEKAL